MSVGVVAPAKEFAGLQGAGEFAAGRNQCPVIGGADARWDFGDVWTLASATELSLDVSAPAIKFAGLNAADVVFADRDALPAVSGSDLLRGQVWCGWIVEIESPAIKGSFGSDGAGAICSGCDLYLCKASAGVAVDVDGVGRAGVGDYGYIRAGIVAGVGCGVLWFVDVVFGVADGGRVGRFQRIGAGLRVGLFGGVMTNVGHGSGIGFWGFVFGIIGAGGQ